MKNYPYPNKKLKDNKDIVAHTLTLVDNALGWLNISGYTYCVLTPDMDGHNTDESGDVGANIVVEYPYKKFTISIQQIEVDKCLSQKLDSPFWVNYESMLFHELIHIILWRGQELATKRYVTPTDIEDENEATTDHLTNVIYGLVKELRAKK